MSTQLLALTLSAKTANTLRKDYADRLAALSLDLVQTSNRAKGTLTGNQDAFTKLINTLTRDSDRAICRRALRVAQGLAYAADEIGQGLPLNDEDEGGNETSVCKVIETPATETETSETETTETETPSNEVLDSLFMVDHGDIRTGADILEDADTTLHALKVALNEGVCDEQNTARVTWVCRVTFYSEEAREAALAACDALATIKNEHPAVWNLIDQSMSEAHGYLWSRRLDLARESMYLHVLENQGYAPPTGYSWDETHDVVDEAWFEAWGRGAR